MSVQRAVVAVSLGCLLLPGAVASAADRAARPVDGPASGAVQTVLSGGIGDGGPAAEALVNARHVYRTAAGELQFWDFYAQAWRQRTASGSIVPAPVPALPASARTGGEFNAASPETDSILDAWAVDGGALYLYGEQYDYRLIRVRGTKAAIVWSGRSQFPALLAVRSDGTFVVNRVGSDEAPDGTTVALSPDGSTATVLLDHRSRLAHLGPDGTLVAQPLVEETFNGEPVGRGVIERRLPDGTVETVAGTGGGASSADGTSATDAVVAPVALAISPDGTRVVYAEQSTAAGNEDSVRIRTFEVGGVLATVAGAGGYGQTACAERQVLVLRSEADAVTVGCGGLRSYSYDGSDRPTGGSVVAGVNAAPGPADSPSGTPLARAFLGLVQDVAVDPVTGTPAFATREGVYRVEGTGAAATLVRILATGLRPYQPNWRAIAQYPAGGYVDADYAPDGTLFLYTPSVQPDGSDGAAQLYARGVDGSVRPLSSPTNVEFSAGPFDQAPAALVELTGGRVAAFAGGLYLTHAARIYRLELGTGLMTWVAGGGYTTIGEGGAAKAASLYNLGFVGVRPGSGELLVGQGHLWRMDEAGTFRRVSDLQWLENRLPDVAQMQSWVFAPDGVLYGASPYSGAVFTRTSDRLKRVVAGCPVAENLACVGAAFTGLRMAGLPDGRLVLADVPAPTARVALVRPISIGSASAPASVGIGSAATVKGRVLAADGRTPLPGFAVALQVRQVGKTAWSTKTTVRSGQDGAIAASYAPTRNAEFRWAVVAGGVGRTLSVAVIPRITAAAPKTGKVGRALGISATLAPVLSGRTFSLQQYTSKGWKTIATKSTDSKSKATFTIKPATAGTLTYRVLSSAATTQVAAGKSNTLKIAVAK
ncbi:MAG: hypothetical protein ACT4QF_19140 [Sporichthyaceae bacterium]